MGKFIEILAMVLGGLSLFAVCFLGFAVMSGKSLGEIPGIGRFVEPEAVAIETANLSPEKRTPAPVKKPAKRPSSQVIESAIGVLPTFDLPSPYSQVELTNLVNDLKNTRNALALREKAVGQRELEASDRERTLAERYKLLEKMRSELTDFEHELDLREQEIQRDEDAVDQSAKAKWAETAGVFAELETATAGERIVEYDAEEAAHILRAMDPAVATEILTAIPPDKWKEYLQAYSELGPDS